MKKTLSLVLALVMTVSLFTFGPIVSASAAFTDSNSITYKEAVDVIYSLGIMSGYSDGMFHGEYPLNKAQICAIMGRILMKTKKYRVPSNPADVIRQHYDDTVAEYALNEVALLLNLGILVDSSRTFNRGISRIDVVEMLYRAFNKNFL